MRLPLFRSWSTFKNQAFRQGNQLGATSIHLPDEAAIIKLADDDATGRAAQRFHAIARLQIGRFKQALDDFNHGFPRKDTGDVMGDRGHDFTAADCGQVGEDEVNHGSPNVGERVAVEEKERSAAMALPQEFYGFAKGGGFVLAAAPLCFKRSIAL